MATKKKKKKRNTSSLLRLIPVIAILLAVGVIAVVLLRNNMPSSSMARATESTLGNTYSGTLVIARNETLYEAESNTSIDFVAEEGSHLRRSEVICKVYSSGYNQTEINRLNTYREQIQNYHENQVFSAYVDAALDSENNEIAGLAGQVRQLVQGKGEGSLTGLERQLTSALTVRKNYLKTKYPDDQNLNELYKIENDQMKKIESWTTTYTANEECLVSFYTDGYENMLNAGNYNSKTPEEVRSVIRGILPEQSTVSRGNTPIFRTVLEDEWYALFLCQDRDWNPVVGETYQIHLEGYGDYVVSGMVESFSRIGGDLLLRMRVAQNVAPVLNIRTCAATVGDYVSGYHVPTNALYSLDNMIGVVVLDHGQQVFIPVTVLSYPDSNTAFVRPTVSGSPLVNGTSVMLF